MEESNIINLSEHRKDPDAPDQDCVMLESSGITLLRFNYTYEHEGRTFSMDFSARDFDDARKLCENIRSTLKLEGQVISEGYV